MARPDAPEGFRPVPDNLPALQRPPALRPAEEARERYWNLLAIVAIVAVALAGLGAWSYGRVDESLRELRATGLAAFLDSEAKVLALWYEEKKRAAERWSADPEVASRAASLAAKGVEDAPATCRSPDAAKFLALLRPSLALEETQALNLISPDGRILASLHPADCDRRLASADFAARVAPVFQGRPVFVRPFAETERLGMAKPGAEVLVWSLAPVRNAEGRIVAAIAFGRRAAEGFGALLAVGGSRSSREAYAMEPAGLLLTRSRYLGDLRLAGLVGEGGSGILAVPVRDPGADLVAGQSPAIAAPDRPLTRLAREALDARAAGGAREGTILDPYRNYRGADVIGAFRWLPDKDMAIVAEIEATEAYAPLHYLEIAFGILLGILAAAVLAAVASAAWAMRLKQREARRLGQYTLERELGEGGISRVYLARHSHLKRPTAVKVLKAALATDEMITRFEREVQLCSRLSHPNTIEIYDYGRTRDGTFFYAMEYLEGIDLEALVAADGPLPASRVVHLLRQACGSLQEAHQRGLVHRDIKPQNLMVCRRGGQHDVLKVLDFGLVKELANEHTRDITQYARVLGTPLYMAPERIRNPADADVRSDIYALGAVAWFVLAGRRLFEAAGDLDLVHQVLHEAPRAPSAGGAKDVPPLLDALVLRCIAKERGERPASIAEVAAVLEAVARERPWGDEQARAWWDSRAAALGIGAAGPAGSAPDA